MLSPLLNTDLISEVLKKSPNLNFGFCFCLLSWRLDKTNFLFKFLKSSTGVIFVELRIVLLCFLKTDVNSDIHEVFPSKKAGFFNKLRIVLITFSAIDGPLSVNLEKCFFNLSRSFEKKNYKTLLHDLFLF